MAVESLPLPFSASFPSIPTRAQAERYRAAIAIAAASVFVAGVGTAYLDAQAHSTAAAPAVHLAVPTHAAAPAVATPVAPGHDAGPLRRYGAGTAVDVEETVLGQRISSTESSTPSYRQSVAPSRSSAVDTTGSGGRVYSSSSSSATGSSSGSTSTSASRYVVRTGDDFGAIGARFGLSANRVAALNPGVDPTQLSIGQSLRIG